MSILIPNFTDDYSIKTKTPNFKDGYAGETITARQPVALGTTTTRNIHNANTGGYDKDVYGDNQVRSEEHTSELQSHSFISYAVFCLKKKNK